MNRSVTCLLPETRSLSFIHFQADYGILSAAHNVGKMSSFLDLSKAAELEQLKKLIKDADVFISNFALGDRKSVV